MGFEVPVFFAPVAPVQREWRLPDAERLIGDLYDKDRSQTGFRSSVSRNDWHLDNLRRAAAALHSSAFDFLERDCACLDTPAVAKAAQALVAILAEASGGLEKMATTCTAEANEFFRNQHQDSPGIDPREVHARAFLEASPAHELEWSGDAGYGACVGYFAFLKSLLVSLTDCLLTGRYLLYYHPPF
jgi:hypothetical protein